MIAGATALIVKLAPPEVAPLETTVTVAVPAVVIRFAGTVAVNCVALTNVVESGVLLHCTIALEANPVPFTVSVNVGPPAVVVFGLTELVTGPAAIVKVVPLEVVPPEVTVTVAVPPVLIRPAGTEAVSCVALTNVVERGEPFHCTTAPDANPVPLTVSVNVGPPADVVLGLTELTDRVGVPGIILKLAPPEFAPPEVTVTVAMPGVETRFAGTDAANWAAN
jgi:hypothetical protein